MSAVLVDTGPLYALAVPSDQHHVQAQLDAVRFRRERIDVVVIYPVVLETYRLLIQRVAVPVAHAWLNQVTQNTDILNPIDEDYRFAINRVRSFGDQPLTLVDGVVAEIATRFNVPVWSYDHHFDVMRIDRWR